MKQFDKAIKYKFKITRTLKHHEIGLIIGSKGNIIIENKKYKINGGMLFYIGPNVPYFIELDNEKASYFMTVHFSYVNVIFNDNIWSFKNQTEMLSLHPVQELKDYSHIGEIFKKLVGNWYEKLPNYEFVTKNLLEQLIFEISESIKEQKYNYSTALKIEKVIKYMNKNINKKITVTELSQLVKLSPTYLSETFKDVTGYSIIKFFNKMKIDKAKELIIEGDKKIKEVAGLMGFTDEFYFSRMFKNIEGILSNVLEKISECDVLLLGSPIYLSNISGMMQSFLERLLFSNITYSGKGSVFKGKVSSGFIYTMGITDELMKKNNYEDMFRKNQGFLKILNGNSEFMFSTDTYQFDDYPKYEAEMWDEKHKAQVKTEQFPIDCENAALYKPIIR